MPLRQKQPGALGVLNLATVHLMAKTLTSPGEVVSTDQLESNVAGLIAQMAGRPTIRRCKVVTVFVDHATGFSFVHFQKSSSAEETTQQKELFLNNMLQALGTNYTVPS